MGVYPPCTPFAKPRRKLSSMMSSIIGKFGLGMLWGAGYWNLYLAFVERRFAGVIGIALIALCVGARMVIDRIDARLDMVRRAERMILYDCPDCEDMGVEIAGDDVIPCRHCPTWGAVAKGRSRRKH